MSPVVSHLIGRMHDARVYTLLTSRETVEQHLDEWATHERRLRRRFCEEGLRQGVAIDDGELTRLIEEAVET